MLSKSEKHNPNYLAKIVRIDNMRKHENADRLMVFTVDGNNIITSNATQPGTVAIYFPLECKISLDYLKANNEFKTRELNSDVNSTGFFEDKGRVKALRLRGEKSEGYCAPISTLEYLLGKDYIKLEDHIGEYFDTINGTLLVEKYVIKEKGLPGERGVKQRHKKIVEESIVENQFRLHYDTEQLKKNIHRLKPEDTISISWKLHGTSFVSSKVLLKRPLKWYERLARWFGVKVRDTEYGNIYSSRNVIKNEDLVKANSKSYYDYDVYTDVNRIFKDNLLNGEAVYGEIVGFLPTGAAIQKDYDYGCEPTKYKVYIYRVTHTNADGQVIDLPFNFVAERAEQLGVEAVPYIYTGRADAYFDINDKDGNPAMTLEEWRETLLGYLITSYVYDQDCQFCKNKVPAEGVVLRIEGLKPEAYKLKAFRFLEGESKNLDKGIVSIEDEQAAEE